MIKDFFTNKTNATNIDLSNYKFETLEKIETKLPFYFLDSGFNQITDNIILVQISCIQYILKQRTSNYFSQLLLKIDENKILEIYSLTKNDLSDFLKSVCTNQIYESLPEFLEKKTIDFLLKTIKSNSIVVRDGSLDNFQDSIKESNEKNILLIGVAKSSNKKEKDSTNIVDMKLSSELIKYKEKKTWYTTTQKNKHFTTTFCKYHALSKYCFRTDIPILPGIEPKKVLGFLVFYSNDLTFLGYPYGLVDADLTARVSNTQKEYYKTLYEQYTKKEIIKNSHDVLDNIMF